MDDFLTKNKGSHEPGMILTLDKAHTLKVEEYLHSKSFKTAESIEELAQEFRMGGNFYLSSQRISNSILAFDLVMGFSSGSIQIEDTFISPKYDLLNFVMVLSRDFLQSEAEDGRNWLSLGGITLQSD